MPTLGEISQGIGQIYADDPYKDGGFGVLSQLGQIEGQKLANRQAQQNIETTRRSLEADSFNKITGLATRIISNPAWQTGDVNELNRALDAAHADAQALGIPIKPGGVLDRTRQLISSGNLQGAHQQLQEVYRQQLDYGQKAGFVIPNQPRGQQEQQPGQPPQQSAQQPVPQQTAPGQQVQQQRPGQPYVPQFRPSRPKADINNPETLPETTQDKTNATNFATNRTNLTNQYSNSVATIANLDNVIKTADEWIKEGDKLGPLNIAPGSTLSRTYKAIAGYEPNAQAGAYGAAKRVFSNKLGLDEDYQLQAKNLANVISAQKAALGGTTNQGQDLIEQANGKVTLSPWVLKHIAEQAKADQTHINKRAQAADTFADKYGDREGPAFDKMWNANADRKVFAAITIFNDPNISDAKKRNDINKLWGTGEAREEIEAKYTNILKLVKYGAL